MKFKNHLLKLKLFLLGILVLNLSSCEENLETNEDDKLTQEVSNDLPESKFMTFDEFELMTEKIIDGEKISSQNKSAKNLNNSDSIINNSYEFNATVERGPAEGVSINGDLDISITKAFPNFSIFRGVLNLANNAKIGVRGAILNDGFVYLIAFNKEIGIIRGVGTISEEGNISGPFILTNQGGRSIGNWVANLKTETPQPLTIIDLALATPSLSTLVQAVTNAELVDALNGEGPFTVFAPTNAAFEKLDAIPDGEALKEILLYHVASGAFKGKDLLELQEVTTLQGEKVTIELIGEDVILNGKVKVLIKDIEASNGIVHVIDDVLLFEPMESLPSIVEIATGNPDFSTLVSALSTANLVEALSGDGPFTVFAPTNAAFEKLDTIPDGEALKEVLLYHVASGDFNAKTLLEKKTVTTLQGQKVSIETKNGKVFLNENIEVVLADIKASNGIVHVISEVLLPLPSIVEIATGNPEFSTLVSALSAANLVEALSGDGPFTVFAPTNAAFEKLDAIPDGEALKEVLLYHVASGDFNAKTLLEKKIVTTLQGQKVSIEAKNGKVFLNGNIEVVLADIKASNGIVHVISEVLLPTNTDKSILEIIQDNPKTSIFYNAIKGTDLERLLLRDTFGSYTVFVPTNDAFDKLDSILRNEFRFLPKKIAIRNLLARHITRGKLNSESLAKKSSYVSLSSLVHINAEGNSIILNNSAKVVKANLESNNGIVHILDNIITSGR